MLLISSAPCWNKAAYLNFLVSRCRALLGT
jgi:hypothetical protein